MIGEKLKEARMEMSISQKQLAGESSLTRSYISMIENGHTVPSQRTLERLAYILRKPLHYFHGETSEQIEVIAAGYLSKAESILIQEDSEAGLEWLDRVEKLNLDDFLWVKSFLMRMEFWISRKRYSDAYHTYMERKLYLEKINDRTLGYEINMKIAKLLFRMERFHDSITHYQVAVKKISGLKSYHMAAAEGYTYLGTCHLRVGNNECALKAYLSAFELAQLEGNVKQLGDISMGIGKAYFLEKELVKSKMWTIKCIQYYKHQSINDYMTAVHNLAIIERKMGNLKVYREKLAKCLWYSRRNNEELFSKCLLELALYKFILTHLDQAQVYCKKSLEIISYTESTYARGEIFRLLGAVYLLKENQDLAYFFIQASSDLFRRIPLTSEASMSSDLLKKNKAEIMEIFT